MLGSMSKMYTILKFLDITDASYFDHIVQERKSNDPTMANVKTLRCGIISTQLGAGQANFIHNIQYQIGDCYNKAIMDKTGDKTYLL